MLFDLDHAADDQLLAAAAVGDEAAFGELFRRRSRDVYRFALHMTGSAPAADDITQEVFLLVMRDASRYQRHRATVVAWLCGIARNIARQRLDRERPYVPFLEDAGQSAAFEPSVEMPLDTEYARAERIEAVRRAVLRLPLRYREVIVLCDLQELSYADAAAALGCAVGTVRSRLHRGRTLLADKLTRSEHNLRAWKAPASKCLA
jgi:RNA polymerase sigma-70 factor (ECF subfamily)